MAFNTIDHVSLTFTLIICHIFFCRFSLVEYFKWMSFAHCLAIGILFQLFHSKKKLWSLGTIIIDSSVSFWDTIIWPSYSSLVRYTVFRYIIVILILSQTSCWLILIPSWNTIWLVGVLKTTDNIIVKINDCPVNCKVLCDKHNREYCNMPRNVVSLIAW